MSESVAVAYMSWGRWVADCPRDGCPNAEHFGRDPDSGHVGGLTGAGFRCGTAGHGCGLTCRAVWPPNVATIEQLLMARPAPATRNWRPGEDLVGLLAENLEHGVQSADAAFAISGAILAAGALDSPPARPAIQGR